MFSFSRFLRRSGSMLILALASIGVSTASSTVAMGAESSTVPTSTATSTVAVVGDSLSAEYGITRGTGWVEVIRNKYLAPSYPNVKIINASISGDTTAGGLNRLPALLEKEPAQIVIIELGANDGLRGQALDQSRQNLEKMRNMVHQQGGVVIFVGMQIPPNFGPVYTKQFAQMFTDVTSEKDYLVPFLMEGFALDMEKFQDDGIHPNESAQEQMADNVWPSLEAALKKLQP